MRQTYSEHGQIFKMESFAKRIMPAANRNFLGHVRFCRPGHFDKYFAKNTRKKRLSRGTFWSFFLLDTLKTAF